MATENFTATAPHPTPPPEPAPDSTATARNSTTSNTTARARRHGHGRAPDSTATAERLTRRPRPACLALPTPSRTAAGEAAGESAGRPRRIATGRRDCRKTGGPPKSSQKDTARPRMYALGRSNTKKERDLRGKGQVCGRGEKKMERILKTGHGRAANSTATPSVLGAPDALKNSSRGGSGRICRQASEDRDRPTRLHENRRPTKELAEGHCPPANVRPRAVEH